MAAPASNMRDATAPGFCPTSNRDTPLSFIQEVATGTATLCKEAPVVGGVCSTFLSFVELVETANRNKEHLTTLRELCGLVINGVLDKRSNLGVSVIQDGFEKLKKHVENAENVAERCNKKKGPIKKFVYASSICQDIEAVRIDVLAFVETNSLLISKDTNEKVHKLQNDLMHMISETMAVIATEQQQAREGMARIETRMQKAIEDKDQAWLYVEADLERSKVNLATTKTKLAVKEAELKTMGDNAASKEEEFNATQRERDALKEQVDLKTKEHQEKEQKRETEREEREQAIRNLKAELQLKQEALADIETEVEGQRRIKDLASRVDIPAAAPIVQSWYVEREGMISEACHRLGIGNSATDSQGPRMVGLAGPGGTGKSTVASMVIAREDVRASFYKGVLWLHMGQGAKDRLPKLMSSLACMVYETVLLKECRPPQKKGIEKGDEDGVTYVEGGATYIREVVDESSRRFLVVADDIWEVEVLEELKKAGVWVLYTSRDGNLLPEAPAVRLDQLRTEEAEVVLRRAAELGNDARLPQAAYDLMKRCEFAAMDLAFVGRWSRVRRRNHEINWRKALDSILEAQKGGEGRQPLSWRAALLLAGLDALAGDDPANKALYLALAVIPKGADTSLEVATFLLYGDGCSAEDREAAQRIVETLERWSILRREGSGVYRIHDEHAEFMQERFANDKDTRDRILPRWRLYMSSVEALVTQSSLWLYVSWAVLARADGKGIPSRPFDPALEELDPSSSDRLKALCTAASFHQLREDWVEASVKFSELFAVQENTDGVDHQEKASIKFTLGLCAYNLGRMEDAEKSFRQALAVFERMPGDDHLDVAQALDPLAWLAAKAGKTEEAQKHLLRAIKIRENALGVDHPAVASTLHTLGVYFCSAGRAQEARALFHEELAMLEKPDIDPLYMTRPLESLAHCAEEEGETAEAEKFWRRALTIRQENLLIRKLGGDHLNVAQDLCYLAVIANNMGNKDEAQDYLRDAIPIIEQKIGGDNPGVADTLLSIGSCAQTVGMMEEAKEIFLRALAFLKGKMGADHPTVASTLRALVPRAANMHANMPEAEEYLRQALAILEKGLGGADEAAVLVDLGMCALKAERTEEAENLFQRALVIQEKAGLDTGLDTATTLGGLAECAFKAQRMNECMELYLRVLATREEKLGARHLDMAQTLHDIGWSIACVGMAEAGEEMLRRALAIREEKLGDQHAAVGQSRRSLALFYVCRGGLADDNQEVRGMLTFFRKGILNPQPGDIYLEDVAQDLLLLAEIADEAGRAEEAEERRRRALAIRQKGVDQHGTLQSLDFLSARADKAGKTEEAEGYKRRALAIRKKLEVNLPDEADTLHADNFDEEGSAQETDECSPREVDALQEEIDGVLGAPMTLRQLRAELYACLPEKSEYVQALAKARSSAGGGGADARGGGDAVCADKAASAEEAPEYRPREIDALQAEIDGILGARMTVGQLKAELDKLGVSCAGLLEKSEYVQALATARVSAGGGGAGADEEGSAEEVEEDSTNPNDPRKASKGSIGTGKLGATVAGAVVGGLAAGSASAVVAAVVGAAAFTAASKREDGIGTAARKAGAVADAAMDKAQRAAEAAKKADVRGLAGGAFRSARSMYKKRSKKDKGDL